MKEQLEKIKSEALAKIDASDALEKLNEIRVAYLGKKGELTTVLKSMKDVAPEERPKVGQMVNEVRALIEERLEETKTALARKAREEQMKAGSDRCDPSGKEGQYRPSSHPNTIALEEVERIFVGMGYEVVRRSGGRDTICYNFEELNIPEGPSGQGRAGYLLYQ